MKLQPGTLEAPRYSTERAALQKDSLGLSFRLGFNIKWV